VREVSASIKDLTDAALNSMKEPFYKANGAHCEEEIQGGTLLITWMNYVDIVDIYFQYHSTMVRRNHSHYKMLWLGISSPPM
jgi:hypothetical protein